MRLLLLREAVEDVALDVPRVREMHRSFTQVTDAVEDDQDLAMFVLTVI